MGYKERCVCVCLYKVYILDVCSYISAIGLVSQGTFTESISVA